MKIIIIHTLYSIYITTALKHQYCTSRSIQKGEKWVTFITRCTWCAACIVILTRGRRDAGYYSYIVI